MFALYLALYSNTILQHYCRGTGGTCNAVIQFNSLTLTMDVECRQKSMSISIFLSLIVKFNDNFLELVEKWPSYFKVNTVIVVAVF